MKKLLKNKKLLAINLAKIITIFFSFIILVIGYYTQDLNAQIYDNDDIIVACESVDNSCGNYGKECYGEDENCCEGYKCSSTNVCIPD